MSKIRTPKSKVEAVIFGMALLAGLTCIKSGYDTLFPPQHIVDVSGTSLADLQTISGGVHVTFTDSQPTLNALDNNQLQKFGENKIAINGAGTSSTINISPVNPNSPHKEGAVIVRLATHTFADIQFAAVNGNFLTTGEGRIYGEGAFHGNLTTVELANGQPITTTINQRQDVSCPLFFTMSKTAQGITNPLIDSVAITVTNGSEGGDFTLVDLNATQPPIINMNFSPICNNGLTFIPNPN